MLRSDRKLPTPAMEESKFKVAVVNFEGKSKPIVLRKSNKSSPLIALSNFSYLRGREVVAQHVSRTTDQVFLTEQIVKSIERFFSSPCAKDFPVSKEIIVNTARSLHDHHTSLDPANTSCNTFRRSNELLLFKILRIPLLHGWVLDPNDEKFKSLMGLSYNNLVELSTLKKQSPSSPVPSLAGISDVLEVQVDAEDTPAKGFLNASKLQLTSYGLELLHLKVQEGGHAVLYANNEYHVLYKYNGDLFTLETSEANVAQLPAAMWRKLAVEEDCTFYVTDRFSPAKGQENEKAKLILVLSSDCSWDKRQRNGLRKKISAFDVKSTKKTKLKRNLTKEIEDEIKDSASINPISDIGRAEESAVPDVDQSSSKDPSPPPTAPPTTPPTVSAKKFDFLTRFQDGSSSGNTHYFDGIVKGMIGNGSFKLYVPFCFIQKHDRNLAIQIQDEYPRIHSELEQSVVNYFIKCGADEEDAAKNVTLEILGLPKPKCNQEFLQFVKENEMVATYILYNGEKDNTPTFEGRSMCAGLLDHMFDKFEDGKGWSEVEKCADGEHWSEGWSPEEMEVRNHGTEFAITKEADVDATQEVVVANLKTFVRHVFKYFEGTDPKRFPAFFDSFVNDILQCPEPKKVCPKWKRFVKLMRSHLAFKASLVRSTLIVEFHRVLSLQLMLTPFQHHTLTKSGVTKDWRHLVRTIKPFAHVYNFRNNVSRNYFYGKWEDSHWHVLQFSRHFLQHVLDYLKKMAFLHDLGIIELIVARRLEYCIANTVRTIVMEYGVDHVLSSAWGHYEASNSTCMPVQVILPESSSSSIKN